MNEEKYKVYLGNGKKTKRRNGPWISGWVKLGSKF